MSGPAAPSSEHVHEAVATRLRAVGQRLTSNRQALLDAPAVIRLALECADPDVTFTDLGDGRTEMHFTTTTQATGELLKVLDFGVVALSDPTATRLTQTGAAPGTAAYMAPEQAADGIVVPQSDLYAVGCIAFELLAGERVFSLRLLQARDSRLVGRQFFAQYDPKAEWFDDLRPALGSWFPGARDTDAHQPSPAGEL